MSRYTGPVCKICRREGMKLFARGEKCYTEKCEVEKRNYPPGVHVETRGKMTEYGIRLREKQKVKRMYGLTENQFKRFFVMAEKTKGITGTNLLVFLEDGWTIWSTASALPFRERKHARWWLMRT